VNADPTLGVAPALGRVFSPAESDAGGARVVMLSHALWSRLFGENAHLDPSGALRVE
jgi:hypothetical protein